MGADCALVGDIGTDKARRDTAWDDLLWGGEERGSTSCGWIMR